VLTGKRRKEVWEAALKKKKGTRLSFKIQDIAKLQENVYSEKRYKLEVGLCY